jgi:hypothetical protein
MLTLYTARCFACLNRERCLNHRLRGVSRHQLPTNWHGQCSNNLAQALNLAYGVVNHVRGLVGTRLSASQSCGHVF